MSLKDQLRSLKSLAGPFEPFNVDEAPDTPLPLFVEWLQLAIACQIPEPHAMTLSTVDEAGHPDARVLILKNVDEHGWHFASSGSSPKGRQIETTSHAALTFYWQPLGRQVRLRGTVKPLDRAVSEADFSSRPLGSRAGALLGKQSDILRNDEELDTALKETRQRLEDDPSIISPTWTVYALQPDEVEFWQADRERRHTRLQYVRNQDGSGWKAQRLWP